MATVHDLSAGGSYKVASYGAIPYAFANSTTLTGDALVYNSNELDVKVDGAAASKVKKAVAALDKRTVIQSGCTGSKLTNTQNALRYCQQLASAAATAATSGSASK